MLDFTLYSILLYKFSSAFIMTWRHRAANIDKPFYFFYALYLYTYTYKPVHLVTYFSRRLDIPATFCLVLCLTSF